MWAPESPMLRSLSLAGNFLIHHHSVSKEAQRGQEDAKYYLTMPPSSVMSAESSRSNFLSMLSQWKLNFHMNLRRDKALNHIARATCLLNIHYVSFQSFTAKSGANSCLTILWLLWNNLDVREIAGCWLYKNTTIK